MYRWSRRIFRNMSALLAVLIDSISSICTAVIQISIIPDVRFIIWRLKLCHGLVDSWHSGNCRLAAKVNCFPKYTRCRWGCRGCIIEVALAFNALSSEKAIMNKAAQILRCDTRRNIWAALFIIAFSDDNALNATLTTQPRQPHSWHSCS